MNNRYVFPGAGTLITTMGAFMFSLKEFLKTTMGYTVKGSNSTTGGAMDGVDRIVNAAAWATRNNGAAGNQSWVVLTDGAGVDWAFSYNSASDDIVRLAHSQGGTYVAAGTPAQQPTATDECFDAASGSWINATTSLDRVWHMWGSSDKKIWRVALYRNSTLIMFLKGEKFNSALIAPATFTLAVGNGVVGAIKTYCSAASRSTSILVAYSATIAGDLCRVHATGQDINVKAGVGGELIGTLTSSAGVFNTEKPALQGGTGELMFPAQTGSLSASTDGKLGSLFDQWYSITDSNTTPVAGETFGNLQFMVVNPGIIVPLDGLTMPVTA